MKTIALLSVGMLLVGCGTTVIGDAVESEVGGSGNRGGATSKGGASGVGGSSSVTCGGIIVDTVAGCLMDDAYCIELADGRYCTGPGSGAGGAGGAGGSGGAMSGGAGGTFPIGAAGTDYVPRGGMGGTPSTLVGGTGGTGGTTQPVTKAYCGGSIVSSSGCYMDDAYCFRLNETQFCTGVGNAPCPDGMIEGSAAECSGQAWCWQQGMSGSCRLPLRTSEECVASGGQAITYISGGGTPCPNELVNLGPIAATLEVQGATCCGTTYATFTNGIPDINAASRCGGRLAGTMAECDANGFCFLVFNGQYCTGTENMRCPTSLKKVPRSECPDGAPWCWGLDAESACTLPTRTPEDCSNAGGGVWTDPGDGSLMDNGCPDKRTIMGLVSPGADEGALCCSR